MRKWILALAAMTLLAAACAEEDDHPPTGSPTETPAETPDGRRVHGRSTRRISSRTAPHGRHRPPGVPAVVRREERGGLRVEVRRLHRGPAQRRGLRERRSRTRSPSRWASPRTRWTGSRSASTSRTSRARRTSTSPSQQISILPKRDEAVDFSDGYYDVNQALSRTKGTPIARRHDARRSSRTSSSAPRSARPASTRSRSSCSRPRSRRSTTTSTSR